MRMIKKKYLLSLHLLFLLLLVIGCTGHNDSKSGNVSEGESIVERTEYQSYIEFDTIAHNFGTLIEGEQVVCYFDFTNSGEGELIINSVTSSCGCTVPDWSKEPLKPAGRGTIKVKFDTSGRQGEQMKIVTIRSNAKNSEVKLKLNANIITEQ